MLWCLEGLVSRLEPRLMPGLVPRLVGGLQVWWCSFESFGWFESFGFDFVFDFERFERFDFDFDFEGFERCLWTFLQVKGMVM